MEQTRLFETEKKQIIEIKMTSLKIKVTMPIEYVENFIREYFCEFNRVRNGIAINGIECNSNINKAQIVILVDIDRQIKFHEFISEFAKKQNIQLSFDSSAITLFLPQHSHSTYEF